METEYQMSKPSPILEKLRLRFVALTRAFEDHDCHTSPDDACRGCTAFLEALEDMLDGVYNSDTPIFERFMLYNEIKGAANKYFKHHYID